MKNYWTNTACWTEYCWCFPLQFLCSKMHQEYSRKFISASRKTYFWEGINHVNNAAQRTVENEWEHIIFSQLYLLFQSKQYFWIFTGSLQILRNPLSFLHNETLLWRTARENCARGCAPHPDGAARAAHTRRGLRAARRDERALTKRAAGGPPRQAARYLAAVQFALLY